MAVGRRWEGYLVVKYGVKPLQFEKGKSAVVVASEAKVAAALETLIVATKAGELDELLAKHVARKRTNPKK